MRGGGLSYPYLPSTPKYWKCSKQFFSFAFARLARNFPPNYISLRLSLVFFEVRWNYVCPNKCVMKLWWTFVRLGQCRWSSEWYFFPLRFLFGKKSLTSNNKTPNCIRWLWCHDFKRNQNLNARANRNDVECEIGPVRWARDETTRNDWLWCEASVYTISGNVLQHVENYLVSL